MAVRSTGSVKSAGLNYCYSHFWCSSYHGNFAMGQCSGYWVWQLLPLPKHSYSVGTGSGQRGELCHGTGRFISWNYETSLLELCELGHWTLWTTSLNFVSWVTGLWTLQIASGSHLKNPFPYQNFIKRNMMKQFATTFFVNNPYFFFFNYRYRNNKAGRPFYPGAALPMVTLTF